MNQGSSETGLPWLAELPSTWSIQKLKYNSYIKGRIGWQNLRADEFTDEGPYLITGMHFEGGGVDWSSCYHITPDRYAMAPEIQVQPGDLLITKDGSIGKLAFIDHLPGPASLNSHLLVIRPTANQYDTKFLYYLLDSTVFKAYVMHSQTGTTFYGISQEAVVNFPALLPPLEEQRPIVAFLDRETGRIDALVKKKERLIELLEEKRAALISRAVTKGLNPDAPMKDSGVEWIGRIPSDWGVKAVKHVAAIGNGSTPNRENPEYWMNGTVPWLNSSVVNQEYVDEPTERVTEVALRECHLPMIDPPAVLVGITGQGRTRGMATTLRTASTINQHMAYLRPDERQYDVEYLRRVVDSAYSYLRDDSSGGGSTKGAITCDQLGNLRVPVPPHQEQRSIVKQLEKSLGRIAVSQNRIHESMRLNEEYRAALISAAVTGKIDVRGDAFNDR